MLMFVLHVALILILSSIWNKIINPLFVKNTDCSRLTSEHGFVNRIMSGVVYDDIYDYAQEKFCTK